MALSKSFKKRLQSLKAEHESLKEGKEQLLILLDEVEVPESVYNSNAIENSTLTLKDTENILWEKEVPRQTSLREVYEAKNLARVIEYLRAEKFQTELSNERILFLHQMLIGGIDDSNAGRFRKAGEYVRVGKHLAPPPEWVVKRMQEILVEYSSDINTFLVEKIARFHLDFEMLHPFNDGNGRIGRVIINWQLQAAGFPGIIIRNKEKKRYYKAFREYSESRESAKTMEKIMFLALMESLHKRVAYLRGEKRVSLVQFAKQQQKSLPALLNAAKRQTIPAFRERGKWMISGTSFSNMRKYLR